MKPTALRARTAAATRMKLVLERKLFPAAGRRPSSAVGQILEYPVWVGLLGCDYIRGFEAKKVAI
jgi:hypothetical protein